MYFGVLGLVVTTTGQSEHPKVSVSMHTCYAPMDCLKSADIHSELAFIH